PAVAHRVSGGQRGRLGALRGAGEVPHPQRVVHLRFRRGLGATATLHGRNTVLVHAHRPVALRHLPGRRPCLTTGPGPGTATTHGRSSSGVPTYGVDAVLSHVRPQPDPARHGRGE